MPTQQLTTSPKTPFDLPPSTTNGRYLYFCYGSNMTRDKLRNRVPAGESPILFDRVWIGCLKDWALCFNMRGAPPAEPVMSSIRPTQGDEVYGLVYELQTVECWHKLIQSEGITKRPERDGYTVVEVEVVCWEDGKQEEKEVKVVRTLMTNSKYAMRRELEPWVHPSQRYMNLLVGGAQVEGFPEEYVDRLRGVVVARRWSPSPLLSIMGIAMPMTFMMRRWKMSFIAVPISKISMRLYAWHESILQSGEGGIVDYVKLMVARLALFGLYFGLAVPGMVLYLMCPKMRAIVKRINLLINGPQPMPVPRRTQGANQEKGKEEEENTIEDKEAVKSTAL